MQKLLLLIAFTSIFTGFLYNISSQNENLTLSDLPDVKDGVLDIQMGEQEVDNSQFDDLMQQIAQKNKQEVIITLRVNLTDNQISDIRALSNLDSLQKMQDFQLNLDQNSVSNISPLSDLFQSHTNLKNLTLNFDHNGKISDISAFQTISVLDQLQKLSLGFGGEKTEFENLNGFENISQLTQLQELRLNLNECAYSKCLKNIDTLNQFASLSKLKNLHIELDHQVQIEDYSSLQFSGELQSIQKIEYVLRRSMIKSYKELQNMGKAATLNELILDISGNQGIQDLESLVLSESIHHLELNLSNTLQRNIEFLQDFSQISSLKNLIVNLRDNQVISDLSPFSYLQSCENLEQIDFNFEYNSIKDLSVYTELSKITQLKALSMDFAYNLIPDITGVESISSLTNLEKFEISLRFNNKIRDIDQLQAIGQLTKMKDLSINLSKCDFIMYIDCMSSFSSLVDLESLSLNFYEMTDLSDIRPLQDLDNFQNLSSLLIDLRETDVYNQDGFKRDVLDIYPFAEVKIDY